MMQGEPPDPSLPESFGSDYRWNCDHCEKSFSRPENLARHRAAYKGILRFQCHCGKRFSRSDLLCRHQKIHERANSTSSPEFSTPGTIHSNRVLQDLDAGAARLSPLLSMPPQDALQLSHKQQQPSVLDGQLSVSAGVAPQELYLAEQTSYLSPLTDTQGISDANLAWVLDLPCDWYPFDNSTVPDSLDLLVLEAWQPPPQGTTADETNCDSCDEPRGWPDRASRYASPYNGTPHVHHPNAWMPGPLSSQQALDMEMAECSQQHSKRLSQLPDISISSLRRTEMIELLTSPLIDQFCGSSQPVETFPRVETLSYYLQLYLLHKESREALLHLPTFSISSTKPALLLSMMLVGSTYSVANRGKFGLELYERTRGYLVLEREKSLNAMRDYENIFALLLLCSLAILSGHKAAYERAESDRGVLMLACKRRRLLDCQHLLSKRSSTRIGESDITQAWHSWVQMEQFKRLGLSIWLFDCQFAALFNTQPYLNKSEVVNAVFPCHESFWTAPSAVRWKLLLGPSDLPPGTYFLPAQTSVLLAGSVPGEGIFPLPKLDAFSRCLLVYTLHLQIYDWRQIMSVLNPCGLQRSVLALTRQQIGPQLTERRDWILKALDNWHAEYGVEESLSNEDQQPSKLDGCESVCGQLIYYLGILAIKISFADLQVLTGRSGSDADILIAKEALQNWLRKADVAKTIDITERMLELSIQTVTRGQSKDCALELAVCLFMGGLICWTTYSLWEEWEVGARDTAPKPDLDPVHLRKQVYRASQTLRRLPECGISRFFASVLGRFNASPTGVFESAPA